MVKTGFGLAENDELIVEVLPKSAAGLIPAGAPAREVAAHPVQGIRDVPAGIAQRAGQRSRARDHRQNERAADGQAGEGQTALEIGRPQVPSPPDPMAQPVRTLVGRVGQEEKREPGRAEQHERGELVVEGQRHAGDEDHCQQQNAVHGAVVAEYVVGSGLGRAPDNDSEHQAVVAVLERRDLMAPREVEVGLGHRVGGCLQPAAQCRRGTGNHRPHDFDDDECPENGTEGMSQPRRHAQTCAHVAPQRCRECDPDQEAGQLVTTQDPATIGDGPAHRPGQDKDERDTDEALVGPHSIDGAGQDVAIVELRVASGSKDLRSAARDRTCRRHFSTTNRSCEHRPEVVAGSDLVGFQVVFGQCETKGPLLARGQIILPVFGLGPFSARRIRSWRHRGRLPSRSLRGLAGPSESGSRTSPETA